MRTVQTPHHGEKGLGWKPDTPDHRDFASDLITPDASVLAEVFSLRRKMPPIWDQSQLGSCVPHGTGSVAVAERMKQGEANASQTPSRLFIYYNGRVIEGTVDEDSGLEVRDGIKAIAKQGAPPETDWPYDIDRFTEKPPSRAYTDAAKFEAVEYKRITPGIPGSPLRTPIGKGFPVTFGFTVPERFESPEWNPATDLLPLPSHSEGSIGGHCVVIVGWDFSLKRFPHHAFECRNSWGSEWGDAGHFYLDARWCYEPSLGLSSDYWIIEKVK